MGIRSNDGEAKKMIMVVGNGQFTGVYGTGVGVPRFFGGAEAWLTVRYPADPFVACMRGFGLRYLTFGAPLTPFHGDGGGLQTYDFV